MDMADREQQSETILIPEAARRLGISKALAYRAAARGELPAIRIGKRVLILRARFEELVARSGEPTHAG